MKPLILDIKGNSTEDGPGIRAVVFFKGCPLSCTWCHNPESQHTARELAFDANLCAGCGRCGEVCTRGAVDPGDPLRVDRGVCDLCGECVAACPSRALEFAGRGMSAEEVVEVIAADKPFFDASGGGATFSGGEPCLHMEFLGRIMAGCRERGISTLVETCGLFNLSAFREQILPHLDILYVDLKIMDPEDHRAFCGVDNRVILENFRALAELSRDGVFQLLPRTPLVPGCTDTEQNLAAIADFLAGLGVGRAQLLEYNPLWPEKWAKIGRQNPAPDDPALAAWMDPEHVAACRAMFAERGIRVG
ncbi:MAG: glycyl-radical enzyme activating protein [Deltaproteobacteria bacterium]|nr:glycyl-radical enzyme activating protein [Deltaproteobacteria bacterium]